MTTELPDDLTPDKSRPIVSSGNVELDSRMGGGLPVGSLVLIEGDSGSGKSVLSQQIIWGSLNDGYRVTLFTSENTVKSLINQMASIDLNVLDFLLIGRFHAYPVELSHLGERTSGELFRAMTQCEGTDMIVVDSLTSAMTQATTEHQIIQFFEGCKRLCGRGQTVMVTLHSYAVNQDLIGPLRSMCDAHLHLRTEQDGQRLVKTLEVAKVRGAGSVTGAIVGFDVEPGWGMRVIPISKARG